MRISRFAIVLFAFLALAVRSSTGQSYTTIHVSGPPIEAFKPVYYGIRAGIFQRYGLNVEPLLANSGNAALAGITGGSADIAFTSLLPVIQAHLRGIDFQVITAANFYDTERPVAVLLVAKNSPIRSGRDLNGQTVSSTALKDLNAAATLAWVDQNGGDSRTLKVIELPSSAALASIDEGRIAAVTLGAPFMEQALNSGKVRVLAKSYDAIGKKFETSGYVATGDYVRKNLDTMQRFARAMHEAVIYTNSHMPETVGIVASYSGVEPAIIAKSARAIDPEFVDVKNIQPLIDAAAKYGIIEHGFNADEIISSAAMRPAK
jgi:NitT/TauT family transport system substrate-binding protein